MKKTRLICILSCIIFLAFSAIADGAVPRFRFDPSVAVGFQGREAVIQVYFVNPVSTGESVEAQLRGEDGNVLCSSRFSSNKLRSMKFLVPDDWQGAKMLSLWADNVNVSEDDLHFAADDLSNKAIRKVDVSSQRMAITIDCAYGDTHTDDLLNLLDEFGIKSTFFYDRWMGQFLSRSCQGYRQART